MSEALFIAVPLSSGVALAAPRELSKGAALLFAVLGATTGVIALELARRGRLEEAIVADAAAVIFDVISIIKALEVL